MSWFTQLRATVPEEQAAAPPPKNKGGRPKIYASRLERQRAWRAKKRAEAAERAVTTTEAQDGQ